MSGYLPEGLIEEILQRLPLASLLKCMSVCKSWYFLIKSSIFISNQLNRSILLAKHDPVYLLRTLSIEGEEKYSLRLNNHDLELHKQLHFPFLSYKLYFDVIGSCNGLICLAEEIKRHTLAFIIWNPVIKKYVYVKPRIHGPMYSFIGFGYDCRRDDYKLLRMVNFIGLDDCEKDIPMVELYSLNEGSWRSIAHEAERYMSFEILSPTFVNGVLHWTAFEVQDEDRGEQSSGAYNFVLGFDMIDEAFCKILLPNSLVNLKPECLSVLAYKESSIALCQTSFNSEVIHVWAMKEYGVVESWTKMSLTISPQAGDIPRALAFRKEGLLLELNYGRIFSWDPQRQQLGDLDLWGEPIQTFVGSFVESLVLLDRENATSYGNDSNGLEPSEADSLQSCISRLSKRRKFTI